MVSTDFFKVELGHDVVDGVLEELDNSKIVGRISEYGLIAYKNSKLVEVEQFHLVFGVMEHTEKVQIVDACWAIPDSYSWSSTLS